jgi:hypothetical protein
MTISKPQQRAKPSAFVADGSMTKAWQRCPTCGGAHGTARPVSSDNCEGYRSADGPSRQSLRGEYTEFFERVRPSSLLKRFATVDEVAAMHGHLRGQRAVFSNERSRLASRWRRGEGDSISTDVMKMLGFTEFGWPFRCSGFSS